MRRARSVQHATRSASSIVEIRTSCRPPAIGLRLGRRTPIHLPAANQPLYRKINSTLPTRAHRDETAPRVVVVGGAIFPWGNGGQGVRCSAIFLGYLVHISLRFIINSVTNGFCMGVGAISGAFDLNIYLAENAHATSKRFGLGFAGSYVLASDTGGNGTVDFGLFQNATSQWPFKIDTAGKMTIYNLVFGTHILHAHRNRRRQRCHARNRG